jgi:hypothetical protein
VNPDRDREIKLSRDQCACLQTENAERHAQRARIAAPPQ